MMGEIRLEYKSVAGILGINHLYLTYRPDVNSPYDDWKIIRIGPTIEGLLSPWGLTAGQIDRTVKDSIDDYDFTFFDQFEYLMEENPFLNWTVDQEAAWMADNLHGSKVIYDQPDVASKWTDMIDIANQIQEEYTYKAWSFSELGLDPTINSNASVGSILDHVGLDIEGNEPYSFGVTPSVYHLIGTDIGETLSITPGDKTVVLFGGSGADTLVGDGRDNALQGGRGDDTFKPGAGDDFIHGGQTGIRYDSSGLVYADDGEDAVDYSNNSASEAIDITHNYLKDHDANIIVFDGVGGRDEIISVEKIIGGEGDDFYAANKLPPIEQATEFTFDGGDGEDTADFTQLTSGNNSHGGVSVNNMADVTGIELNFENVETIIGTDQIDIIDGGDEDNVMFGLDGDDDLTGGNGDDTLEGGLGVDSYIGGAGADTFIIGEDDDVITDADANDRLYIRTSTLTGASQPSEDTIPINGGFFFYEAGSSPLGQTLGADTAHFRASQYQWVGPWPGIGGVESSPYYTGLPEFSLKFDLTNGDLLITLLDENAATMSMTTVENYQNGDLGLTFEEIADPNEPSDNYKPFFDDANPIYNTKMDALTSNAAVDPIDLHLDLLYTGSIPDPTDGDDPGTSGPDTIVGTDDDNLVVAGDGDDDVQAGDGDDYANGGDGDDTLDGEDGDDFLYGEDGADTLTGGTGTDTLNGGAGNDVLIGGLGADALDGGVGVDTASYIYASSGVSMSLANPAGNTGEAAGDTYANIENVAGSAFNDILTGDGNDNVISGNDGLDYLRGNGGADTLNGGNGSDHADYRTAPSGVVVDLTNMANNTGDAAGDVYNSIEAVDGSQFADTLTGDGSDNILLGWDGDDVIATGIGNDRAHGGNGADTISGGDGADDLRGDAGDDTLNGDDGDDILIGGLGADALDGGVGVDTASYIYASSGVSMSLANPAGNTGEAAGDTYANIENVAGSAFNDILTGDGNDNVISGNDGLDYLRGNGGADTLNGGNGSDHADYRTAPSGVVVDLTNMANNTGDAAGDVYNSIEAVDGSQFADTLTGDGSDNILLGWDGDDVIATGIGNDRAHGGNGADTISGGDGADDLRGDAGDDTLNGEDGNDYLMGGAGADTLNGGNGSDHADYRTAPSGVVVDLTNMANNTGDAAGDVYNSIEAVDGSNHADMITGDATDNILLGWSGDDVIATGIGNDRAHGGSGADTISGGDGDDILTGDAGDDTLTGGDGDDYLAGGAGDDTFAFLDSDFGQDIVVDFASGAASDDVIEFDDMVFADFNAVIAAAADVGSDTVITLDAANTLTLQNVSVASLHADDFRFV